MIPLKNLRRFARKTIEQPFYALRVGWKRMLAYMYYRFSAGKAPMPEALTIFLTNRCNLHCKMCGQWGDFGTKKSTGRDMLVQELSINELKKFIDDVSNFKPNITLFGGEPFIYKNIMELARYIKEKKLHCLVITNGSILKNFAEEIVRLGLDELNLSVDGGEKTHDGIRGMDGLFNRIKESIESINYYKEKYKSKKPLLNLQYTINKDNYSHMEEMIQVAELFNANSVTFHNLIFLENETYEKQEKFTGEVFPEASSSGWKGFVFNPGVNPEMLVEKIKQIRKIKTGFFINFYPNFSDREIISYYKNPTYLPESYKPRCVSPWIVSYIFTDGSVRPCLNLSYSYGNIKENIFKDIWNSKEAVNYRKILKKHKIFPACIRCTELFRY